MIRKLRRKFIVILMCVATVILLAVFASMLISTQRNNQNMSENMLRQALNTSPPNQQGFRPPTGGRMPILVAAISEDGRVAFLSNQLHFMDEDEAVSAIIAAVNTGQSQGTLKPYGLRWLKSDDGRRIALADISLEQEMLKNLIINALLIGVSSLTAFFLISLFLARWTVHPVERAWERQRQFVADASHELKTPLTVILSNADMLSGDDTFADEKKYRRMQHIKAEATRMKKLIEDLLTLAKSDSMESVKIRERVDFSFVVTSAALTFEPIIYDERKKLHYDVRDNLYITGDAQRLQQLVVILLDNAVKYCPPGGQITVTLEEARKSALLTVVNDGEPIPGEELPQVFERFYRVDKSRSTHGGFGLGLSIAQGIVTEHGGKIWAERGEKSGNRFCVAMPFESIYILRTGEMIDNE